MSTTRFLLILMTGAALLAASAAQARNAPTLPRPPALEPAVAYWREVFGVWSADLIVYSDGYDLARIYEVHRLPPSDGTRARERRREELRAERKQRLAEDLLRLAEPGVDYDALDGRRQRLHRFWDGSRDPETYRLAADNLRSQRGARESFRGAVARSTRYLDRFREIFREEGVPEELVYLPHVESAYLPAARSGAGALGMWQFMSATARSYMLVNDAADERLDPFTAARAAARYLAAAYEELGAWPVAITSYNHGVDGMKNAIRVTGSDDIAVIIAEYRGPLFGFAGRNFYPELLAAIEVSEALRADPEGLELDEPARFDVFPLPAYVKIAVLARALGVPERDLAELNPSLSRQARAGDFYLPKGLSLKVPEGVGEGAPERFASIPAAKRPETAPPRTYRVRRGDSLGAIAARHRTTVRALQRLNGISNPNHIRVGMVLTLPH